MSSQKVNEAAEAVCSALWQLGWGLVGEADGGRVTVFVRDEPPHAVRVTVGRDHTNGGITVGIEWTNMSLPGQPVRGRIELAIEVRGHPRKQVEQAVEAAVLRCLYVYRDVLTGEGVASIEQVFKSGGVQPSKRS